MLTGEGKIVTDKVTVRRVEEAVAKEIVAEFEGVKEISFSQIRKRDPLIGGYRLIVKVNDTGRIVMSPADLSGTEESVKWRERYNEEELAKLDIQTRTKRQNFDSINLESININYTSEG